MNTTIRIYNGPHPEVEVPLEQALEDGSKAINAIRGEKTVVPQALADRLDQQGETWLHADGRSRDTKHVLPKLVTQAAELGIEVPEGAVKADVELLLAEHVESEQTEIPEPPAPTPLNELKRAELNDIAREQDIEDPEKLPNKEAVIEAIEAKLVEAQEAAAQEAGDTGVTADAAQEAGDGDTGATADAQTPSTTADGGEE